ncbi:MAG: hypothetical protein NT154_34070 [Verrucomicrobia bacterium]|nr:hypothetical protein [Verrucomicrobiota bacterium]
MFSHKKRVKIAAKAGVPSGKFPVVPLTQEHAAILSQINSPWFEPLDPANTGIPREEALWHALRSATEAHVAEYVFVVSRPAAESRAVLARGRSHFTEAAMDFALKFVCREDLGKIVAGGALSVLIPVRPAAEFRSSQN